jgi:hypothetical protein
VNAKQTPAILVYGNCQAGAVSAILGPAPGIKDVFEVRYLPSFDDRVPGSRDLDPESIGRTTLLLEQFDRNPFPFRELLSADCKTVTFPSIDLNLLWPLRCANPLNDAPTEDFPWGHYPEADRIILDCVERGMSADETLAYYNEHSAEKLPNLRRYAEMERARLQAREANCDVAMSDVVFGTFAATNLFWCANHPTMSPLRDLCSRLMRAAAIHDPRLANADIDAAISVMPPQGPLGFLRVPIHPAIVAHFAMTWYAAEDGRSYGIRSSPLTYDEYFHGMAETAIRSRDQLAAK